jgi:hypothetical protein
MSVKKYAEKALEQIRYVLDTEHLTSDQRLELQAARLKPWLPITWSYRITMAIIFFLGTGSPEAKWIWLSLPLFSPRIIAEAAYLMGRIRDQ